LEEIPGLLADPATGQKALPEVIQAYWQLKDEARLAGWRLSLSSGYRSFKDQSRIWNGSYDQLPKKIRRDPAAAVRAVLKDKSVPGLSRHHWATELDITEINLRGQLSGVAEGVSQKVLAFYRWMDENAPRFGFCRVYRGLGAVSDERWHWSYLKLATVYGRRTAGIGDLSKIEDPRVRGMAFIRKNIWELYRLQVESVSADCAENGITSPFKADHP
jgi:LAS superfamily LD-carboxypeptidase LdcB